jgi:hypothetical protein
MSGGIMPYTLQKEKNYSEGIKCLVNAVLGAVDGLEGKFLKKNQEQTLFEIQFPKTIHGQVLGDRTYLKVELSESGKEINVKTTIYPVDAVGRKMLFGVRKGVAANVLNWFFAHLEHRLGIPVENRDL